MYKQVMNTTYAQRQQLLPMLITSLTDLYHLSSVWLLCFQNPGLFHH